MTEFEERLRAVERATDLIPAKIDSLALEMRGAMRDQTRETAGLKEQVTSQNSHIAQLTERNAEHVNLHATDEQARRERAAELRGREEARSDLWRSIGVGWKLIIGLSPFASAAMTFLLSRVL